MPSHRSVHAFRRAVAVALWLVAPLSAMAQQPRKAPNPPAGGAATPSTAQGRTVTRTRAARPLDLKLNTLRLNGSFFDIEEPKTGKVTATWLIDPSQAGAAMGLQVRVREGAIPPGDCPGKPDDVHDSAYLPGLSGSFELPIGQPKFEVGKTYSVKGCLMDQNAQYTGDETNTVGVALTQVLKTAKYKLTGWERLSGKAYDAEAFASTAPGFIPADYYLGLGEPIKIRTTLKNVGKAPASVTLGQKIALTLWLDGGTGGIGTIVTVSAIAAGKSRSDVLTMATGGTSGVDKGVYQMSIEVEQPGNVPSADKVAVFEGPKIQIKPVAWELWPVMIRIFKPPALQLPASPGAIRVRVRNYGPGASFPTTVKFWDMNGCYPTLLLPLAALPGYGGAGWSSSAELAWGLPVSSCTPDVRAGVFEADKNYPSFSTGKVKTFTDWNTYIE
jgi:hypothetical protein